MIASLKAAFFESWDNEGNLLRIESTTEPCSILEFLSWQSGDLAVSYWKDRDSDLEIGGVGVAKSYHGETFSDLESVFAQIQGELNSSRARYMGNTRFSEQRHADATWQRVPVYYYRIPTFEWGKDATGSWFALTVNKQRYSSAEVAWSEIERKASSLNWTAKSVSELSLEAEERESPSKEEWLSLVESAKTDISRNKDLDKVVLARKKVLTVNKDTQDTALLAHAMKEEPFCFSFLMRVDRETSFFGCTPESLFRLENQILYSESVAGTRSRNQNDQLDTAYEKELLDSDKDCKEHGYVHQMIESQLSELCESVLPSEKEVLKLNHVQHLRRVYSGRKNPAVTVSDCFKRLHPTPAVAGYPIEESVQWIQDQELDCDRGWYSGAVGWIAKEDAQFSVAIRSALLKECELHVFSGAGIVEGSQAEDEWDETEIKMKTVLGKSPVRVG